MNIAPVDKSMLLEVTNCLHCTQLFLLDSFSIKTCSYILLQVNQDREKV